MDNWTFLFLVWKILNIARLQEYICKFAWLKKYELYYVSDSYRNLFKISEAADFYQSLCYFNGVLTIIIFFVVYCSLCCIIQLWTVLSPVWAVIYFSAAFLHFNIYFITISLLLHWSFRPVCPSLFFNLFGNYNTWQLWKKDFATFKQTIQPMPN